MILLDTNYLIRALVAGTTEADEVSAWLARGEELCTSSIAWYEFLCGPVDGEGIELVRSVVSDRVLPFTADQAAESARLYSAVGRSRRLRVDAMITAAAIVANAHLATDNREDFGHFTAHGLRLVESDASGSFALRSAPIPPTTPATGSPFGRR